jgi:hypothetical protein
LQTASELPIRLRALGTGSTFENYLIESLVTGLVDGQTQNLLENGSIVIAKNLTDLTACHARVLNL